MKDISSTFYHSTLQQKQDESKKEINLQVFIFLGLIVSTGIDITPYFNFHLGSLQVSLPDLFLCLLIYGLIADMAVGKQKFSVFSLHMSRLIFFAGIISLINLLYVGGGRFIMYDVKISLKLFEHAILILVAGSTISEQSSLKRSLKVLCFVSLILSMLTILQSLGIFHIGEGFTRRTTLQMGPFLIGTIAGAENVIGISFLILAAFPLMTSRFVFNSLPVRSLFVSITILAVIITFTRSLWVSLIVEIVLLISFYITQFKSLLLKCILLVLLAVAIIFFIQNIDTLYSLLVDLRSSTVTGRTQGYLSSLSLVFSNPIYILFGAGKGHFLQMQFYTGKSALAHNFLIDLFVSKGIIVLLIVITFMVSLITKLILTKAPDNSDLVNIGIIATIGIFFCSMFTPSVNSIQFWLFMALMSSMVSILNTEN
jgi:hypothetical protein